MYICWDYGFCSLSQATNIYNHIYFLPTENRRTYFETARLLLEAGSITTGPRGRSPLSVILDATILTDSQQWELFVRHICLCEEALPLRANLLELLLKHGAELPSKRGDYPYNMIIIKLAAELADAVDIPWRLKHLSLTADRCHVLIGILGDMLCCLLLAGSDRNSTDVLTLTFTQSVTSMVAYTSKPGRSNRFLGLILYGLSVSLVNELKSVTSTSIEVMTKCKGIFDTNQADTDALLSDLNKLLKCLGTVEIPRRLEDLARREIIRVMSHRCLHTSLSLGISTMQQKYVLLEEDLLYWCICNLFLITQTLNIRLCNSWCIILTILTEIINVFYFNFMTFKYNLFMTFT